MKDVVHIGGMLDCPKKNELLFCFLEFHIVMYLSKMSQEELALSGRKGEAM